jgi:hypothetical protein
MYAVLVVVIVLFAAVNIRRYTAIGIAFFFEFLFTLFWLAVNEAAHSSQC